MDFSYKLVQKNTQLPNYQMTPIFLLPFGEVVRMTVTPLIYFIISPFIKSLKSIYYICIISTIELFRADSINLYL